MILIDSSRQMVSCPAQVSWNTAYILPDIQIFNEFSLFLHKQIPGKVSEPLDWFLAMAHTILHSSEKFKQVH